MTNLEIKELFDQMRERGSILGLSSIRRLLEILGNPEKKQRIVHIAGTNGKGSILAFLESMLCSAKIWVGKYTSPAVFSEREIFCVNGKEISKDRVQTLMSRVGEACRKMEETDGVLPTIFEAETAAAFLYFAEEGCELSLIETGLGGCKDATNVEESAFLTLFSSISLDHTKILGNTIEKITEQKAGILRRGCPVVSAQQTEEAWRFLKETTEQMGCEFCVAGRLREKGNERYEYISSRGTKYSSIVLSLQGEYQRFNAAAAIEAAELLMEKGIHLSYSDIRYGLEHAIWPGRFEFVMHRPDIILDGAHNPAAVTELAETIQKRYPGKKIHFLMGVLADKDYSGMIKKILPLAGRIDTVTPKNERRLLAEELSSQIKTIAAQQGRQIECRAVGSAGQAVQKICQELSKDPQKDEKVVIAFGSLSYLGEVRKEIKNENWNKGI